MTSEAKEHASELYRLFWEINFQCFGGVLPPIELRFSGRLKTTGGQYFRKPAKMIQISARYFAMEQPWQEIRDTLGHEMIHYWLDFQGKPCGHTPEFHRILKACGFQRYSRLSPVGARFLYLCPGCDTKYYRRKRGTWSCGLCSGPRYNPLFRLMLTYS